jgi:hypothetical protein
MKDKLIEEINFLKNKDYSGPRSFHIFLEILKGAGSQIPASKKLDLLGLFSNCEKSLREARMGNRSLSLVYLSEVDKYASIETDAFVQNIQKFVILPAKAFHSYQCKGEFEKAIDELSESIASIGYIAKHNHPEITIGALEQCTNICRVLYRMKRHRESFEELGKLISLILTRENNCKFIAADCFDINNIRTSDEFVLMFNFIVSIALDKWRLEKDAERKIEYFDLIFVNNDRLSDQSCENLKASKQVVEFLRQALYREIEIILDEVIPLCRSLWLLPNMLQYLFLMKIDELYSKQFGSDSELQSTIKEYCCSKLSLDHLFKNEDSFGFIESPIRATA